MIDLSKSIERLANASVQKQVVQLTLDTLVETLGSDKFSSALDKIFTALDKAVKKSTDGKVDIASLMASSTGLSIIDKLLSVVLDTLKVS